MATEMIALPTGLVIAGGVYIGLTLVVLAAIALLCSPMIIINRRKTAYWDDWNASQKAPWLFWHIGGLWYRVSELLGNYVLPAPQVGSHQEQLYLQLIAVCSL